MASSVIEREAVTACIHCGTPFRRTPHRPDFCCAGCEFVHSLIEKNDLGRFYELRDEVGVPVTPLVFLKRDFTWLADLVAIAENGSPPESRLTLDLQGISCIGCVWLIEKVWERLPGAVAVRTDPAIGRLDLRWRTGELDVVAFARQLQAFGYLLGPPRKDSAPPSRALVLRIGLCGAFALNTMLFTLPGYLGMERTFQFAPLFDQLALLFGTLGFLVGGSYFIGRTWRGLQQGVMHLDLPISLGLVAAYFGSLYAWATNESGFVYFDFVSVFVFLMLAGRWLQQRSIEKNRDRLLGLQSEPPGVTLPDGTKQSASGLVAGIRYAVGSGQHVPVCSKLLTQNASFGMEWINGESDSHLARAGRLIASGAMNLGGTAIELEAVESWHESMLARLLDIPPAMAGPDRGFGRFIRGYILGVLAIALLGAIGWLAVGASGAFALQVVISVLVVSCPCALGVALPMADELAASRLRKIGVFVRDATLWSRIRRVRKIVFDKTGTLTLATMALRNPEALWALPNEQLRVLSLLVRDNVHPVSCCLREQLMAAGVEPVASNAVVEETPGFGLECQIDGSVWRLGRPGWHGVQGSEDCVLSCDGRVVAAFSMAEDVRADAPEEISALGGLGYQIHILSGDRPQKVAAMARRLRIPPGNCRGAMSPEDKAAWLRNYGADDALMIGDGANDSLAFNESLCRGTPAIDRGLLEQKADFYFLGRGLAGVRQLVRAAARRHAAVRWVVAFAICYNTFAITLCLAGKMSPLLAAILMPISSLVSLAIVFAGSGNQERTSSTETS